MDKLVPVLNEHIQVPCWIEDMGNYNKLPTPYREVPSRKFWYLFDQWPIVFIETRQVSLPQSKTLRHTYLFWKHDQAFAIVIPERVASGEYASEPTYYTIGCEHDWGPDPDRPGRMHLHPYRCRVCGLTRTLDSSG